MVFSLLTELQALLRDTAFHAEWLEYDWVGDNIYFAGHLMTIGLCGRATLPCRLIITHRIAPRVDGGSKFVLDPTKG